MIKAVDMAQAKRAVLAVGGGCDFVISGPKHQRQRVRSDWSGFHKRDAPMSGRRRPGRSPRKAERAVPPQVIDMACRAADGDGRADHQTSRKAERAVPPAAQRSGQRARPTQRVTYGRKAVGSEGNHRPEVSAATPAATACAGRGAKKSLISAENAVSLCTGRRRVQIYQ